MDKYDFRRFRLKQLIDEKYGGSQAALAAATNIHPSYISRMLVKEGNGAFKRIGEKTMETIEAIHPGWFKDGFLGQLEFFYRGMSDEHKEALIAFANHLYSQDNPHDRLARPFHAVAPQKEKTQSR